MKRIEVVAAIIFNKEGKLLIARRKPHKSLGGKWELPGGKVEVSESHPDALTRELKEEFGITARVGQHFMTNIHDYQDFSIALHGYLTEIIDGTLTPVDHDGIEWIMPKNHTKFDIAEADIPILLKLVNYTEQ